MPKIITTNFGTIADALNKLIIAEVKAALRLLPGKRIGAEGVYVIDTPSLCRIVVSPGDDYQSRDLSVRSAWLDDDDRLHVRGLEGREDLFPTDYDEDADWLDITDFHYLIEQCKDLMPDGTHKLLDVASMKALDQAIYNSTLEY